jgi:hypothetical protein
MADNLKHALHNERASNYLFNSKDFSDWVVTTAIYSAIFFVHHELFPGFFKVKSDEKRLISTFEDYLLNVRGNSPHKVRLELVRHHLPEIFLPYKTLHDTCQTARYKDYQISEEEVIVCRDALSDMKSRCNPTMQ